MRTFNKITGHYEELHEEEDFNFGEGDDLSALGLNAPDQAETEYPMDEATEIADYLKLYSTKLNFEEMARPVSDITEKSREWLKLMDRGGQGGGWAFLQQYVDKHPRNFRPRYLEEVCPDP